MRTNSRVLVLGVLALMSLLGSTSTAHASPPPNLVVTWNLAALSAFATAKVPAPAANRLGAIVQSAVFDAVNGIERKYTAVHVQPAGPEDASAKAAAAAAAYETLIKLFPAQAASLDAQLAASLQSVADDEDLQAIHAGIAWGTTVADQILAWRSSDGFSATPPPYVFSTVPGQWQPTPGGTGPPKFRTLGTTIPFALMSPSQFRPGGPPALTSSLYQQDLAELESVGGLTSTTRSAFQTETARFWQGDAPVASWDRVADSLVISNRFNLLRASRLLALVNISIGDAIIAVFDAKNVYNFWRPVTAINLTADASWQPLTTTPYFQEYPSAHSGTSSAAGRALASVFGNETTYTVTSAGLPGVTRTFASFSDGVAQVADARVFAGFHFRFSCDDAITMGARIADYVIAHVMLPAQD